MACTLSPMVATSSGCAGAVVSIMGGVVVEGSAGGSVGGCESV